jgi:peptide/nickel transport system substrate-binding protein
MIVGAVLVGLGVPCTAVAHKKGGTLKICHRDSPASMSILEEATISTVMPMMGVFNNLVIYDQNVKQNSLDSILPELAAAWSWSEDGRQLIFKLRDDVKWHDGKPFTAKDVVCTWDLLLGKSSDKLRTNPRKIWYQNVAEVTANGDREAVFYLTRPQPALIALLASGYAPIYPCHVPPRDMRSRPIGTGPFKFTEFKPNERIAVTRNPDYWKKGRPYLDGIEYTIIPNRSTAMLAFEAGKFDMTFPDEVTIHLLKEVSAQAPDAICEVRPTNVSVNSSQSRQAALQQPGYPAALALALDRKASSTYRKARRISAAPCCRPRPASGECRPNY